MGYEFEKGKLIKDLIIILFIFSFIFIGCQEGDHLIVVILNMYMGIMILQSRKF